MAREDVLKDVEQTIKMAKMDIKRNGSSSDKIRQFSSLTNSYTRLLTHSEILDDTDDGKGDSGYYARMVGEEVNDPDAQPS